MTPSPNRTPENENEWQLGIDPPWKDILAVVYQFYKQVGEYREYMNGCNGVIGEASARRQLLEYESWLLADRKAQAAALLGKGPKDIKLPPNRRLPASDHDYRDIARQDAINRTNAQWRSIIKEYLG